MARSSGAALHKSDALGIRLEGNASTSLGLLAGILREKVLRSATYAGARVLYDEMSLRAAAVNKSGQSAGQLAGAIYHWHDDKASTLDTQTYYIGVNKKKAPHWALIEFGHWMPYVTYKGSDGQFHTLRVNGKPVYRATPKFVPAQPYVRPTWEAKKDYAINQIKVTLAEKLKAGR